MNRTEQLSPRQADSLIRRHAKRLGLTPERLTEALLQYATHELVDWTKEGDGGTIVGEKYDPGSVWHVGDPPDWLKRFLPELALEEAF